MKKITKYYFSGRRAITLNEKKLLNELNLQGINYSNNRLKKVTSCLCNNFASDLCASMNETMQVMRINL